MSFKTVEVELENGRVRPSGAETLPAKAHALLTLLAPDNGATPARTRNQADWREHWRWHDSLKPTPDVLAEARREDAGR